jgi:hypothetical protein
MRHLITAVPGLFKISHAKPDQINFAHLFAAGEIFISFSLSL